MTAPPLWKSRPPTAGSKARASGAECQCECSASASRPALLAFGSSKSSVEEKIESENVELRLCLRGLEVSANVEALPRGLWRRGDWLARTGFFAFARLILVGAADMLSSIMMA